MCSVTVLPCSTVWPPPGDWLSTVPCSAGSPGSSMDCAASSSLVSRSRAVVTLRPLRSGTSTGRGPWNVHVWVGAWPTK